MHRNNGTGSQPDLSKELDPELCRKRKLFDPEEIMKEELSKFRTEIMQILREFGNTQNKKMEGMSADILSTIREEIREVKDITHTLNVEQDKIKHDIQSLQNVNTDTNTKIEKLQEEMNALKVLPRSPKSEEKKSPRNVKTYFLKYNSDTNARKML
ncbi:hypothetical protein O0L34_g15350 [Tuta absoluta]|nr:hypothetical protein O0L34_g15350 [Tuta absoluta]